MIKASEAIEIAISNRMKIIDKKIREESKFGNRCLHLRKMFRLNKDERRILQEAGYEVSTGHSGKGGEFDIISW